MGFSLLTLDGLGAVAVDSTAVGAIVFKYGGVDFSVDVWIFICRDES